MGKESDNMYRKDKDFINKIFIKTIICVVRVRELEKKFKYFYQTTSFGADNIQDDEQPIFFANTQKAKFAMMSNFL